MRAEVPLHFVALVLSYFLRVTAAYFACWMLNRLLSKPRQRFIVCLIFLVGTAAYWLELAVREFRTFATGTAEGFTGPVLAPAIIHSFLIPQRWSHAVMVATKGLGTVYLAISIALIGMAAWKHLRMRVLLRHAVEPSSLLSRLFLEVSHSMGISQSGISRAKLVVLPGLNSPATAGWWSPQILLPQVCEELGPTPQIADVLYHELIHVARWDYLWTGLSELICCLLFFHPAVWKARKAMVLQAELACDMAVLETRPGDCADYADSLTYFVRLRMLQEGFSLGVDFAASASLGLRIRTILTAPKPTPWWQRLLQTTAVLSLVAVFGIAAPAMEIDFGFAEPLLERPSNSPLQTAADHSRNSRHSPRRASTHEARKNSLTALRTRPYVSETPAYTMTSKSSRPDSGRADQEAPAWRESQPMIQHPSVSSIVRTTLGEIAARGVHGGHDRDRDNH
jgi:beta-lactamase regulating signal transducer with metallopeptidase domain